MEVYLTTIRPILKYGVQIWQDIPEFLSNKLEFIQKRALHIIYPCHSYFDALNISNLSSLKERRTQLCCKYIRKMSQNDHPINFLIQSLSIPVRMFSIDSSVPAVLAPFFSSMLDPNTLNMVLSHLFCCSLCKSRDMFSPLPHLVFMSW